MTPPPSYGFTLFFFRPFPKEYYNPKLFIIKTDPKIMLFNKNYFKTKKYNLNFQKSRKSHKSNNIQNWVF